MKKIFKSNKGFTLVELLAVIVILAIIMVIATQQIGKVIAGARADSFVETYQMIERQVKTYISSDQTNLIECNDLATEPNGLGGTVAKTSEYCSEKGNYGISSSDYLLKVTKSVAGDKYEITLYAKFNRAGDGAEPLEADKVYDGKFKTLNLNTSGKASNGTSCAPSKISNSVTSCEAKKISGSVNIND